MRGPLQANNIYTYIYIYIYIARAVHFVASDLNLTLTLDVTCYFGLLVREMIAVSIEIAGMQLVSAASLAFVECSIPAVWFSNANLIASLLRGNSLPIPSTNVAAFAKALTVARHGCTSSERIRINRWKFPESIQSARARCVNWGARGDW